MDPLHAARKYVEFGARSAQVRVHFAAQNTALADVPKYQAQVPVFNQIIDKKTGTALPVFSHVAYDPTPFPLVYNPASPHADPVTGMAPMSNVSLAMEGTNLNEAHVHYSACLEMASVASVMEQRVIESMA